MRLAAPIIRRIKGVAVDESRKEVSVLAWRSFGFKRAVEQGAFDKHR